MYVSFFNLSQKLIGYHNNAPWVFAKQNVRLIIPTHRSTNPENLEKIGL